MSRAQGHPPSTQEAKRRADAVAILTAGLEAVEPAGLVHRAMVDVLGGAARRGRLLVLGAGKAVGPMLAGLLEACAESALAAQVEGVVAAPAGVPRPPLPRSVEWIEAGHPLPDAGSEAAGRRMLAVAGGASAGDVVVVLLSGGASALMSVPAPGLARDDLTAVTAALTSAGTPIGELNAVRKHLSAVAGGRLAVTAAPARVVVLVISDVVGDDLSVIGSGPTCGDSTTYADCLAILEKRAVTSAVPARVRAHLEAGAAGAVPETPRPGDLRLAAVEHRILAGTLDACRAMTAAARARSYRSLLVSHLLEGEARELGVVHAGLGAAAARAGIPLEPPCALVTGGEATVTVRGPGRGGRNQETCLAAVSRLEGLPVTFLSAGTDGVDGPTEAAGGLVDGGSALRARHAGVDVEAALATNDSATALAAMGDQLITGPTGTNVADVRLLLVGERL